MSQKPTSGVQPVAQNRRARHRYTVEETLEAGLALTGSEVKSLREGTVTLTDAYALPKQGELFLVNAHIGPYRAAVVFSHEPLRARKLLLHRHELDRWTSKALDKGYVIVPLEVYFKDGRAKVQLGLCRGKAHEDRRAEIKERETRREMDRALRRR